MTALNKQSYRADGGDIGIGRLKEIADNAYSDEEKRWLAQRVLGLLDELEAAENCIAEHRKVLNSLAAVARRYLPDYDEHPEIQAADELLESTAGFGVKGE
ncbi:hypothetical protein ACV8T5_16590 [Citrobacter freundii]|uniref:hypothetical protein n=1 Tax=Citrobacter freundii TaxID=546 RepID=UPI00069CEA9F|nr:hypothetical protein [Citrobacter freundii]MDU4171169.1 hypothetical protein [Citrobacter freundii]WIJ94578.1 hypothetical protein OI904_24705 [Citrobacter freundii]